MICGVPSTSTAGLAMAEQQAAAAAWSTATGCGTTRRASRTGTRSGPGTASGSCLGRPRCGSTHAAAGSQPRISPDCRHAGHAGGHRGHRLRDYSWFVLTQNIIEKEFALWLGRRRPDRQGHQLGLLRVRPRGLRASGGVQPGLTSWWPGRCRKLVAGMNKLTPEPLLELADWSGRPSRATGRWTTRSPKTYRSWPSGTPAARVVSGLRTAPHKILNPKGQATDRRAAQHLDPQKRWAACRPTYPGGCSAGTRCIDPCPPVPRRVRSPGSAAGECAGARSLEGSFLGGCLFSGRRPGRGPRAQRLTGLSRTSGAAHSSIVAPSFIAASLSSAGQHDRATSEPIQDTLASVPTSSGRILPSSAMTFEHRQGPAESMVLLHGPPPFPAEHGRRVDQQDPLDDRIRRRA